MHFVVRGKTAPAIDDADLSTAYPRAALVDVLEKVQVQLGNIDQEVNSSLDRIRAGGACVVTGQQVGLFGGPTFTVLKAISALLLARQIGATPLFWAATEDHDVGEIASTYRLGRHGDLVRYKLTLPEGQAVESIPIDAADRHQLDTMAEQLGFSSEVTQGAERIVDVGLRALVELLRGTGILFIEPKSLRPLARDFFLAELSEATRWRKLVSDTAPALQLSPDGSNLFWISDSGRRHRLVPEGDAFRAGENLFSVDDLLDRVLQLSPNVAARPLFQNALIPVKVYVAGPSELTYLEQLKTYAAARSIACPPLVLRNSVTFVPKEPHHWLTKLGMQPWEEFPKRWDEQSKKKVARDGMPSWALHYLRNLFEPQGRPQERIFNWMEWQQGNSDNLVQRLLEELPEAFGATIYAYTSVDATVS